MEHDDRERAANLRRLRKPKPQPDQHPQLSLLDQPGPLAQFQDLALALATAVQNLLDILPLTDASTETIAAIGDIRNTLALDVARFVELRADAALSQALRNIRHHLGLT